MLDLTSEVIRTLVTTLITTVGGIIGALLIERFRNSPDRREKKRTVGLGAFIGLTMGVVLGITLATFWPTGDPCLRAKISAPQGTKNSVHAAAYQVDYKIPISWTPPSGERCVMVVQSYQKANPVPVKEYKAIVSGTILEIGERGSGETQIKIWVDGASTSADDTWVWIK
jgi:hypothetical protein